MSILAQLEKATKLKLRYVETVKQLTIAELINPQSAKDAPTPIDGHCSIGNMRFSDFPAEQLHMLAKNRNHEVYEMAKEYANLMGDDWDRERFVTHRLGKPKLNEEVERGSAHDLARGYSPLLGRAINIQALTTRDCRFTERSHVVSFLIPTLNVFLSYHDRQELSDFKNGDETPRNYDRWKNFILSEKTAATKFFSKSLTAYVDFEAFQRHAYIVGGTGSGKSELLKLIIHHIIANMMKHDPKVSGLVIDPHGDMGTEIARFKECQGNDNVILFDPTVNTQKTPSIDLFHLPEGGEDEIDLRAGNIKDAFDEIIGDASLSEQMKVVLIPCIAVLLRRPNSSLEDLQRFMQPEGNEDLIELGKRSPNRNQAEFFRSGFMQKRYDTTKGSIYTRLQSLLNSSIFSRLVNPEATLDLEHELNNGKFIIMNFPKGSVGGDVVSAFGRLVISQVKNLGLRRQKMPESKRPHTYIFVDECQNFVGDSIKEILVEARKYKVFLTLANQVLGQDMDNKLVNTILSNTDVKFIGKNSPKTLTAMGKEVGASLEELQTLVQGKFCGHTKSKRGTNPKPFFFRTPTYLLGNNHSMSSDEWYQQKVRGWKGYVDNNKLDGQVHHEKRHSTDEGPTTPPTNEGGNAPRFKL